MLRGRSTGPAVGMPCHPSSPLLIAPQHHLKWPRGNFFQTYKGLKKDPGEVQSLPVPALVKSGNQRVWETHFWSTTVSPGLSAPGPITKNGLKVSLASPWQHSYPQKPNTTVGEPQVGSSMAGAFTSPPMGPPELHRTLVLPTWYLLR